LLRHKFPQPLGGFITVNFTRRNRQRQLLPRWPIGLWFDAINERMILAEIKGYAAATSAMS